MIQFQNSTVLLLIYLILMTPSLLFVKQTYQRILDLKYGIRAIMFLPITVVSLILFVFFIFEYLAVFPLLNLSWLGYNIAIGPYGQKEFVNVLPFLPFLAYTFLHVNYFEEYYFRTSRKRVVIWAFLHLLMGVTVSVAIVFLPLGFFYKYVYGKYGINYAFALHFFTNMTILTISLVLFVIFGNKL